jgi:hypothetical protein
MLREIILVRKPHGRPRQRWEDKITTDLRETGYEGTN